MPSLPTAIPATNLFGNIPLDVLILGIFAALVAFDSIRNGTRRAAVFSIAAPLALILYNILPNARFVGPLVSEQSSAPIQAGFFGLVFVVTFLLLYRMVPESGGAGSFALQGVVGAVGASVVLVVVWLQMPGLMTLWSPSHLIQIIFGPDYRFFWLVGAYTAFALTRR